MPDSDDVLADPIRAASALSGMHRRHALLTEGHSGAGLFGAARPDSWHYGSAELLAYVAEHEDWRAAQEAFRTTSMFAPQIQRLRTQPTILLLRDYHFDQISQKSGAVRRNHEKALALMLLAFGGMMTLPQDDFDQLQIKNLCDMRNPKLKDAP